MRQRSLPQAEAGRLCQHFPALREHPGYRRKWFLVLSFCTWHLQAAEPHPHFHKCPLPVPGSHGHSCPAGSQRYL